MLNRINICKIHYLNASVLSSSIWMLTHTHTHTHKHNTHTHTTHRASERASESETPRDLRVADIPHTNTLTHNTHTHTTYPPTFVTQMCLWRETRSSQAFSSAVSWFVAVGLLLLLWRFASSCFSLPRFSRAFPLRRVLQMSLATLLAVQRWHVHRLRLPLRTFASSLALPRLLKGRMQLWTRAW